MPEQTSFMYRCTCYFQVLVLSILPVFLPAQGWEFKKGPDAGFAKRWSLGINVGPDFLYGDLTKDRLGNYRNVNVAGGLALQYQITNVFGARLQLTGAWLNGMGDTLINGELLDNPLTGLLFEGNANVVVNFMNLVSPYRTSRWFFLYGTVGLGYTGWYTEFINQAYDAGSISTNNPLNNFHSALVVPVGLGALFKLGNRVNASLEYSFHFISSDLLDQTVKYGDSDRFDYLAFGISVNLGKTPKKPLPLTISPSVYVPPEPAKPEPKVLPPAPPTAQQEPYTYAVQICAYALHNYTTEWVQKRYRVPMTIRLEKSGRLNRFLVGNCSDFPCALDLLNRMLQLGIRDAFIVAYSNGVRHHEIKK